MGFELLIVPAAVGCMGWRTDRPVAGIYFMLSHS